MKNIDSTMFENEESLSAYPDLQPAITMIRSRLSIVTEEQKPLLEKWLSHLEKVEAEMRHLERIESLTSILTQPNNKQQDES